MLTYKQWKEFVEWYKDRYWTTNYEEAVLPTSKQEEEEQAWKEKLTEILWPRRAKQKYIHKGWRVDTYLDKVFSELWLYCWPIFKD